MMVVVVVVVVVVGCFHVLKTLHASNLHDHADSAWLPSSKIGTGTGSNDEEGGI